MKLNVVKIKEALTEQGISQSKLAEMIGCSFLKINYLLNEKRSIYLADAEKIAEALDLSEDEVILFNN